MDKLKTQDDCPKCLQSYGMVFYVDRRVDGADGYGEVNIGRLSCPVCGHEEIAYAQDYQIKG